MRNYLLWIFLLFMFFAFPSSANNAYCSLILPQPELVFTGTEDYVGLDGNDYTRYMLEVENFSDYPDELFAAAPHLPPCGMNTNASRTWVDIFDSFHCRLYGFCAFDSSDDLTKLWFAQLRGSIPPDSVYIKLDDRETNTQYVSNLARIPEPSSLLILGSGLVGLAILGRKRFRK